MVKINKQTTMPNVPVSLRPPFRKNFAPQNIPRSSRTTSKRRGELIRNGAYIDQDIYNSRYKLSHIKIVLIDIYQNKCAFCEQRVEQFHVEHYRPKQIYYWLAFSWDNLISACSFCNEFKDVNFNINGPQAISGVNFNSSWNINTLSAGYDVSENPDLVNPEVTNPHDQIVFHKDGNITSANPRFTYTIGTCHVDRQYLNDLRKKILDDFRRDVKAAFVDNATPADQAIAIQTILTKFKSDTADKRNEFLAFRQYLIDNWMNDEIKNAKN